MHRCSTCAATRDKPAPPRTPNGWKRRGEALYCRDCWRGAYILRAITFSVASPLDCTWEELRAEMRQLWGDTTQCANWIMTELYARDCRRKPGDEKMPAMERQYLYPEIRERWPLLPSQSVSSIEQAAQAKYRSMRYDVVWRCAASLPTFRYPAPFPIHNRSWAARIENDAPVVDMRLIGRRVSLRLAGGKEFRRQRLQFLDIISGDAIQGEAAIYERGTSIMVKLVAWLPREAREEKLDGEMSLVTASDALLIAVNAKDKRLWTYNADHVRRWVAEHRKRLQRMGEDAKFERRADAPMAARRKAMARKFNDRMSSALHEISAAVAGYAKRRRFAKVVFDDRDRGYCEQFPWFRLKQLIEQKLDAFGIELASGEVTLDSPEPLAREEVHV